jgi:hypothetical protein
MRANFTDITIVELRAGASSSAASRAQHRLPLDTVNLVREDAKNPIFCSPLAPGMAGIPE